MTLGPLDVDRHGPAAISLAREAFVESFGSPERFQREHGADGSGLLPFLRERQRVDRRWVVGAEEDGQLVGLLVLGPLAGAPAQGHLMLLVVVASARGSGLASRLLALGVETMQALGWSRARLHVTERNGRALRFYLREGWTDVGEHPTVTGVRVLERDLGSLH